MNNKSTSPINKALRNERLLREWSQKDVADHLGTTTVTVNRWERGIQQPSPIFRFKLSALFGKSEAELGLLLTEKATNDPTIPLSSLKESTSIAPQGHAAEEQVSEEQQLEQRNITQVDTKIIINTINATVPLLTKSPTSIRLFQQPHRLTRIFLLISVFLVVSIGIGASLVFTTTPSAQKTIATFCQALVEKDFQTAYDQFSHQLQQQVPKSEITKPYSACTTAPSIVSDARPQCTLLLTTEMNIKYWRLISLALDKQHLWKIDSWGASHKG